MLQFLDIYIQDIYRYRNINPLWPNIFYGSSSLFKYLIKCYTGFIDYCYALSNALLSSSASNTKEHKHIATTSLDIVTVWIQLNPAACFLVSRFPFFFFFFLRVNSNLTWVHCAGDKNHHSCTVHHCSCTKKYLKWISRYYSHI